MLSKKELHNLIGKRFGKLTVSSFNSAIEERGYYKFNCICECGNEKSIYKHHLISGQSTSCGCSRNNRTNWKPRKDIKSEGMSGFNYLYSTYKRNALKRDYEFKLTKEEFYTLTKQNCYYCGCIPSNKVKYYGKKNSPPYVYNGVDRLNNDMGYVLDNSVPCCKQCNIAKNVLSEEEFINWIKKVVSFRKIPFETPSGPTIMFDVDDTLVYWNTPEGYETEEIEIDCEGVKSYRVANIHNINLLKKMYESGHVVILWSGSGVKWCRAIAKALSLTEYVHGYQSKPTYYIDDKPNPKDWIGKHGYIDINGNRTNEEDLKNLKELK